MSSATNTIEKKIERMIESAGLVKPQRENIGRVISSADGVVVVAGLRHAPMGGCIEFENEERGLIFSLQSDNELTAVVLGAADAVKAGMVARLEDVTLRVPAGRGLLGRVVDGLGRPIDGRGVLTDVEMVPYDADAPSIISRRHVSEPFHTGTKIVDTMIPIGRGQRELIIGDRGTGKTTIAIDAMLHQHKINSGVVGVYVAIGQKLAAVSGLVETLRKHGALDNSVIVVASAADAAAIQAVAPMVGCAIGEYFMKNSQHAVVVYDDLSKHADAYRQISLLLRRPPGREAYPGDAFYVHAKLLERSAKLGEDAGGGSLTALPIIETKGGDITTFIATNVISITDGQIFLDSKEFNEGKRPAINIGLSVSRVGSSAQWDATKSLSKMKAELAQYKEMEGFCKSATSIDDATQAKLDKYHMLQALLEQGVHEPMQQELQCVLFEAYKRGAFTKSQIKNELSVFIEVAKVHGIVLLDTIRKKQSMGKQEIEAIDRMIATFKQRVKQS